LRRWAHASAPASWCFCPACCQARCRAW
jgi:hypothetical protein